MKKKFNWIDLVIILILLTVVLIVGLKFKNVKSSSNKAVNNIENTKKQIVLLIEDVRSFSTKAINIGDKLYSGETNHYFGEIVDIKIEDSYVPLVKDNGEVVLTRSPEKYNIFLTVDCNILERPNGYFSEGITEVKVNSVGKYKTIGLLFSGRIYSIEE